MNFPMWSRRALALRVTTQVSRWGKVALNVLPVHVPSLSLYSVKKCLAYSRQCLVSRYIVYTIQCQKVSYARSRCCSRYLSATLLRGPVLCASPRRSRPGASRRWARPGRACSTSPLSFDADTDFRCARHRHRLPALPGLGNRKCRPGHPHVPQNLSLSILAQTYPTTPNCTSAAERTRGPFNSMRRSGYDNWSAPRRKRRHVRRGNGKDELLPSSRWKN